MCFLSFLVCANTHFLAFQKHRAKMLQKLGRGVLTLVIFGDELGGYLTLANVHWVKNQKMQIGKVHIYKITYSKSVNSGGSNVNHGRNMYKPLLIM